MSIDDAVAKLSKADSQAVLSTVLSQYLSPAFGALPKREIDLIILKALTDIGYVKAEPTIYDLVSNLRVTRTKARNLIYEQELRRLNVQSLDEMVKDAVRSPMLQKQQDLFGLEIENPLVTDHFRSILKEQGHIADGTFSSTMVRVTLDGLVAVIEYFLTDQEAREAKKQLVRAGAPDKSVTGVLKSVIKAAAGKVAKESGEAAVDSISAYISPILDGTVSTIADSVGNLFSKSKEGES